jgi:hypothetical protein
VRRRRACRQFFAVGTLVIVIVIVVVVLVVIVIIRYGYLERLRQCLGEHYAPDDHA